jgi:hypothetical protein
MAKLPSLQLCDGRLPSASVITAACKSDPGDNGGTGSIFEFTELLRGRHTTVTIAS